MIKEYSWNTGFNYSVDANDVGKEFEKLGDNLTPEAVVNVARNENNIMHSIFEWDDSVAGEKYRKIQATQLIKNLKINIISNDNKEKRQVRAFVSLQRNTGFKSMEAVVNDTDQYQLLLDKAYKELYSIKLKYETLSEIQDLLKDIPEIY